MNAPRHTNDFSPTYLSTAAQPTFAFFPTVPPPFCFEFGSITTTNCLLLLALLLSMFIFFQIRVYCFSRLKMKTFYGGRGI